MSDISTDGTTTRADAPGPPADAAGESWRRVPVRPLRVAAAVGLVGLCALLALPFQAALALGDFGRRPADALRRLVCRSAARAVGMEVRAVGRPTAERPALFVANHVSYLDILALGALLPAAFVAKDEIRDWPVIGRFARLWRTVWIGRRPTAVGREGEELRRRLAEGDSLILFPEGTTGDGAVVLPFKSALLAPAFAADGPPPTVQPVGLVYVRRGGAPLDAEGRDRLAWYGDRPLWPHFVSVVSGGAFAVEARFFEPVAVAGRSRKEVARLCRERVAAGLAAP